MTVPIGLQLYSIRSVLAKDYAEGIRQVAEMGFSHVECAFDANRPALMLKETLDSAGLGIHSLHASLEQFRNQLEQILAYTRILDCQYLVMPFLKPEERTVAHFHETALRLNAAGRRALELGIKVCYHNHSFEFQSLPNKTRGIDLLLGETDPRYVQVELDTYWVKHGGEDPVAWIKKLAGRLPLLHVKDMAPGPERRFIEIGTGLLDFRAIIPAARLAGVKHFILEQDEHWINNDPMASVKMSLKNFQRLAGG
jgi:sugar phosphate isomerase/epimerase